MIVSMNWKPFVWLALSIFLLMGLYWGFRVKTPPQQQAPSSESRQRDEPASKDLSAVHPAEALAITQKEPATDNPNQTNVPDKLGLVRVVDHLGRPVEGAIVVFASGRAITRKTDGQGLVPMEGISLPVAVLVSHEDYQPLTHHLVETGKRVDLTLKSFCHFSGRVIDETSRKPVRHFSLKVSTSFSSGDEGSNFASNWESIQDNDGLFRVDRLTPENALTVWIESEDYGIQRFGPLAVNESNELLQPRDLLLKSGEEFVSGTVFDHTQTPVGGVRVILSGYLLDSHETDVFHWDRLGRESYPSRMLYWESQTEANGRFAFNRPGGEFGFDLLFLNGGIARHRLARLGEAETNAYENMTVSVVDAASVRVNLNALRFPDRVHVNLQHQTIREIRFDSVYQPDAQIAFDGLPPGEYALVLLSYGGGSESRRAFSLQEGEKRQLRMGFTETCSLAGKALIGAQVLAQGWIYLVPEPDGYALARRTRTLKDGGFFFSELEPGNYILLARRQPLDENNEQLSRFSNRISVVLPEHGLDQVFTFARFCNVQGRILGSAISEVALMGDNLFLAMMLTSPVGEHGSFHISDVPPGTFDLVTAPQSGARVLIPDLVVLEDGVDIDLGDLNLAESGSLLVHVGDKPSTDTLTVFIKDESGHFLAGEALEDPSVGTLLEELPAGPIQVALFAFESSWESLIWLDAEVFPGKVSQVVLDMAPVTRLMIRTDSLAPAIKEVFLLELESGETFHLRDEGIRLRVEELVGARAGFLDDRLALIKNVTPGRWRVTVIDSKNSEHVTAVVLQAGQPRTISF